MCVTPVLHTFVFFNKSLLICTMQLEHAEFGIYCEKPSFSQIVIYLL